MVEVRSRRGKSAYALCEGAARSGDCHGIGVVIKNARHQRLLAVAEQVRGLPSARAPFAAIAEALRAGRRLGIDRITIYCPDSDVVDQINRREQAPPETLAGCLEVRALLHTFRRAEVVALPGTANLEAAWLARQAACRPTPETARKLQPALPLGAA